MTSPDPQLREMIPLYLNGSLNENEARRFEAAVLANPELQRELDEFKVINTAFDELPMPDDAEFEKLFQRVQTPAPQPVQRTRAEDVSAPGLFSGIRDWLRNPFLSWGVALAQFVVIALVLVYLRPQGDEPRYQTLSQTSAQAATSINIVFQPAASVDEIATLLHQHGLQIKSGPGAGGKFVVGGDIADPATLLQQLRQAEIIRFAENNLTE